MVSSTPVVRACADVLQAVGREIKNDQVGQVVSEVGAINGYSVVEQGLTHADVPAFTALRTQVRVTVLKQVLGQCRGPEPGPNAAVKCGVRPRHLDEVRHPVRVGWAGSIPIIPAAADRHKPTVRKLELVHDENTGVILREKWRKRAFSVFLKVACTGGQRVAVRQQEVCLVGELSRLTTKLGRNKRARIGVIAQSNQLG